MGFEIFIQCHANGGSSSISRAAALAAFGDWVTEESATLWRVDYGGGVHCYVYVDENPDVIAGAMVERPVADERFWSAVYCLMNLGNVVLFWPGCTAPLVANASVVDHLPRDMVETLGTPLFIRSGKDILMQIRSN